MKSTVLIIITLLMVSSCNEPSRHNSQSAESQELEKFINNYYEIMSDRQWQQYQQLIIAKASLTTIWSASPQSEPTIFTSSIEEFLAQTDQGPDSQPIFEEKPLEIEVEIRGDLANVWAKYEARFGSETELTKWKGTDLFTLMRFQGQWYITSLTYLSE